MIKELPVGIGTSGYSYDDWIGPYYPEKIKKGEMLQFYSNDFLCVEINFSYYQIANPYIFAHMNNKTPDNFEFIVKLHSSFTHKREFSANLVNESVAAISPIMETNKFKGFLAQFPYSFKYSQQSLEYLKKLRDSFKDTAIFIEFRNDTWLKEEVYDFLKTNVYSYVNVDEPPLNRLLPPQHIVTSETAYIRFHGRNSQFWWNGDNFQRYNYLYSQTELENWLFHISKILKKSVRSYMFFNNHPQGKAIKNAKMMSELIQLKIMK